MVLNVVSPTNSSAEPLAVAIGGELDISNMDRLRDQLEPLMSREPRSLTIDVAGLRFMDSSGIALLVQLASRVVEITVRNLSPLIRRVLQATGVADLLGVNE